mmetsp:Transcript_17478/g.25998  ORF Transcript_17478/g.25998 Transcript_17478/m.25998 type:complete len:515 (+) Transcript_17478:566-2110(+)
MFSCFHFFSTILVVLLLAHQYEGLIFEKNIHTNDVYTRIEQFGFSKKIGTISLRDVYASGGETFTLCSSEQWKTLLHSTSDFWGTFCVENETSIVSATDYGCELAGVSISDPLLEKYQVKETSLYTMALINCDGTATVRFTMQLLNGDEQLPLGEENIPKTYFVICTLWVFFLVCWIFEMMRFRNATTVGLLDEPGSQQGNGFALHCLLAVVILLKLCVVCLSYGYWRVCSDTGYCYNSLEISASLLFAVSECSLFCALLLIAKGWKITRPTMPPSEARTISFALVILLSTLFFFSVYNEGYYFLSLMILYFFMLPKIFHSVTLNTSSLHAYLTVLNGQLLQQQDEESVQQTRRIISALHVKLKVFRMLRSSIILYLCFILIASALRIVMVWSLEWITVAINELVVLFMVLLVCIAVRPARARDGLYLMTSELFDTDFGFPMDFAAFASLDNNNNMLMWDNSQEQDPAIEQHYNTAVASKSFVVEYPRKDDNDTTISLIPMAYAVRRDYQDIIV